MFKRSACCAAVLTLSVIALPLRSTSATQSVGKEALSILAEAESKFQPPTGNWFDEAQQALKGEVQRVSRALEVQSKSDANVWKSHLRWELLERNLGPPETVKLNELQLVRRWLFSNRRGLESPFLPQLRTLTNQYLDAVFTLQHADLRGSFVEKVDLARQQSIQLSNEPTDVNAAALGRTLAWFDQTRQLTEEVGAFRELLSLPNAQLVLSDSLIDRIVATEIRGVTETVPISDTVDVPSGRFIQRSRTMQVRGSATSQGIVSVSPTPNEQVAELVLAFDGTVDSTALGRTGPVTIHMAIAGSARAAKPIYVSPGGIRLGETAVVPQVSSRVSASQLGAEFVERLARQRAAQPESRAMNRRANAATVEQLQTKLDQRVKEAIAKMQEEASRVQSSLREFQELAAPLEREGATPRLDGLRSTSSAIQLNARAEQRGQFGAAASCPHDAMGGDIQFRLHVSAFNNMAETITGGKTLDDKFFMKYAKVLHAELPLPLMVHSRSDRWAFTMQRHRPIELVIPQLNHFDFIVRIGAIELEGRPVAEPAVATIHYELRLDDLGDYALHRLGDVELQTGVSADVRRLVHEKIDALFGPVLDGGGVVIPEGGILAPLRRLKAHGVRAEREWITIALDVPLEAIEEFRRFRGEETPQLQPPARITQEHPERGSLTLSAATY